MVKHQEKGEYIWLFKLFFVTLHWNFKYKVTMYNKINVQRHKEERRCINCGTVWTIYCKSSNKTRQQHFCKECNALLDRNEKRIIRNKVDSSYNEKVKEQKRQSHKNNIIHYIWFRAKKRAEKYGYDFNIEESDIIIPKVCPILEVPIVLGNKGNYEYTPSLDRIDNTKGYVKGNIQVISKKANSMKNSATIDELKCFCKNVLRYSLSNMEQEHIEQENKESLG